MRALAETEAEPRGPSPSVLDSRTKFAPALFSHQSYLLRLQNTIGNQAVLRMLRTNAIPLQRKLAVGVVNDPLEAQADAMAARAMNGPAQCVPPSVSAPSLLQRKCSCVGSGNECHRCKKEGDQRSIAGPIAPVTAPPIVHDVLRSPGQSLDAATASFMGPRFGADFSDVRVHTDPMAAESAAAVDALAYTVGRNVVFGTEQYRPDTPDGQRLLAHELAHVVQQSQAVSLPLQRACRSAAQCALPSAGNAGQFGGSVEAESEANAIAAGGVVPVGGGPASCPSPRHGERAQHLMDLATTAGLGVTIPPTLGFYISACLSVNDGASNASCGAFPGGAPDHRPDDDSCVQVHVSDEEEAKFFQARRPETLSDPKLRLFLEMVATVAHEAQHHRFDPKSADVVTPGPECNLDTIVPNADGHSVKSLLSEISAEIGEFDVYYRYTKSQPGKGSTFAMQSEEHNISTRQKGENILGNIKDVQCVCECGTVAKFVEEVFDEASSTWTREEKIEFKKAMTGFMPSFWPPSRQQT
jgi:Domain of unknown function (DUF4157)